MLCILYVRNAGEVRRFAKRAKDAAQARRLLAIAGGSYRSRLIVL